MKIGLIVKIDEKKATKGWLMAEEYHVVISNLNELSDAWNECEKTKNLFRFVTHPQPLRIDNE